jgi:hypothetical protein
MGCRNTLAYVQLDDDKGGVHLDLYESVALTKIRAAGQDGVDYLARRIH